MLLYPVRCSYVAVFAPSKKPNSDDKQYTVCAMIPKTDKKTVKLAIAAQTAAIKDGIEKGKYTMAQVKSSTFKKIIRDGDAAYESEERGIEFKGMYFFSCNRGEAKGAPQVVKRDPTTKQIGDITNQDEFYSGAWAALDINFYPYNAGGSKGVAVGLNNVMLYKDDERLDGRSVASDTFKDLEDELEHDAVDPSDEVAGDPDFDDFGDSFDELPAGATDHNVTSKRVSRGKFE